jgi:hypothetical protein
MRERTGAGGTEIRVEERGDWESCELEMEGDRGQGRGEGVRRKGRGKRKVSGKKGRVRRKGRRRGRMGRRWRAETCDGKTYLFFTFSGLL